MVRIYWHSTPNICWYIICLICLYRICHICWYTICSIYNLSHTITEVLAILAFTVLTNTCTRFPTINFFVHIKLFRLTLTFIVIPLLIGIACRAIELAFTIAWNMFYQSFSFIYSSSIIYHLSYTLTLNTYFYKPSTTLQLSLHLSRLTIHG